MDGPAGQRHTPGTGRARRAAALLPDGVVCVRPARLYLDASRLTRRWDPPGLGGHFFVPSGHARALVTMGAVIDPWLMSTAPRPASWLRAAPVPHAAGDRLGGGIAGWASRASATRLHRPAEKGGRGMRISLVGKEQASPVVQRIYHALELRSGSVAPYFRVLAHKPDVLRAFNQLHVAIWADGALAAKLKHLAYLRVSILDGCGF